MNGRMSKASQRGGAGANQRPRPQARRSFSDRARRAALLHTGPLTQADRRADRGRSGDDLGLEAPPAVATRGRSLARARRDAAGRDTDAAQARIARGDDYGARAAAATDGRNQARPHRRQDQRTARLANTTEGLPAGAGNYLRRHPRVPGPVPPITAPYASTANGSARKKDAASPRYRM